MRLTIGVVIPIAAMFIALRRSRVRECGLAICACAAGALGLGLSSVVWWLLLQLPIRSTSTLVSLDVAIWAAMALGLAAGLPRLPRTVRSEPERAVRADGEGWLRERARRLDQMGALVVLLPVCALAAVAFAATSAIEPQGAWDAWAIWNARARFLFLGLPSVWRDAFAPLPMEHAGYPLLLPASIARAWTFAGYESVAVPIALAALVAAGIVVVAGASIRREGTTARGLVAAAFILASPAFVTWAPSQGADIPLSLYMLLTFVFVAAGSKTGRGGSPWVFAGLSAGLAAWTKNEGLVFVLVVVVVIAFRTWRTAARGARWRWLAAFAVGAAPALSALAFFKLAFAPPNDILSAQSGGHVLAMLNGPRLQMIARAIGRELWYGGAVTVGVLPVLAGYVVAVGIAWRGATVAGTTFLALGMMLAAYAAAYVITPHDLSWHLGTSLERLIVQLTPSLVWGAMLLTCHRDHGATPPVGA
jgi:hypothetical protein